jgi:AraC-like DNA-binding protein
VEQESVVHRVHPRLRPFVAAALGYRPEGMAPGEHLGLPSPFLTFVVPFDEPLEMAAHPDPAQAPGRYDGLVGGLHTRPARIAHPGRQAGIQLSLTPAGARALLGCPAGALVSLDVPLDDALGGGVPSWWNGCGQRWAGRRASPSWRRYCSGSRTTTRPARRSLAPKEAARVVRFDRARRELAVRAAEGRPLDLAGLAGATGFADQAHLTREWRSLAGLPPTRWLAAEFGFVQDTRALTAALSEA